MSGHFLRAGLQAIKVPTRSFSVSPLCARPNIVLDAKQRDEIHPTIGSREIVGYGHNGDAVYYETPEYPCPAIRFREDTPSVLALKQKEKGDWKSLTLDEKKELYRASFRQTYAEMEAPDGEWRIQIATIVAALAFTGGLMIWMKKAVYPDVHDQASFSEEFKTAELMRMVEQRQGAITGVGSKWDYEKGQWKETRTQ